jgi:hypothetical protein
MGEASSKHWVMRIAQTAVTTRATDGTEAIWR